MHGMDGPTEVVLGVAAGLLYLGFARETAKWVYGSVRGTFIDKWVEKRGTTIQSAEEVVEDAISQFMRVHYGETVGKALLMGVMWPGFWGAWLFFWSLDRVSRNWIVAHAPIRSNHERWLLARQQQERDTHLTVCTHKERTDEGDNQEGSDVR